MTGKRHGFHAVWKVGFDADGKLARWRPRSPPTAAGASTSPSPCRPGRCATSTTPTGCRTSRCTGGSRRTHKTSQTAFRGFGGPAGHDRDGGHPRPVRARCSGSRPASCGGATSTRRATPPPTGSPCATRSGSSGCGRRSPRAATSTGALAGIAAFNAAHEHTKRALAITPVKFGISFNLTAFNQAGALVHVYKDGTVLINHGGTEMGQGLHTKMLQVAATALGVPLSLVRLAPTRTDKVPNTSATAASSGADLNGGAVKNACEQIRTRFADVAAGELGVHPDDVRFVDGIVTGLADNDKNLTFAEVVHLAYYRRVQLSAAGLLPHGGPALGREEHARRAVQVLRVRGGGERGGGRRVHRGLPAAARRHRARRRRQPLPAGRPRPGRGRVRAGRGLAHARGPALGHGRRPHPRAAVHPGGQHVQAAELLGDADGVPGHAAGEGGRGRRGVWRPRRSASRR